MNYEKFEGHTPGPWIQEGRFVYALMNNDGFGPAHINRFWLQVDAQPGWNIPVQEMLSNAALITAAPELLEENKRLREALELALKTLQDIQGKYYGDPIPDSVFEVVTSALK